MKTHVKLALKCKNSLKFALHKTWHTFFYALPISVLSVYFCTFHTLFYSFWFCSFSFNHFFFFYFHSFLFGPMNPFPCVCSPPLQPARVASPVWRESHWTAVSWLHTDLYVSAWLLLGWRIRTQNLQVRWELVWETTTVCRYIKIKQFHLLDRHGTISKLAGW